MLIRVIVKNLFSFNEPTEFNLLPGRFSRMPHHIQQVAGLQILKTSVIYGANGAGKSNLIRSLALLAGFVRTGQMPTEFLTETFKFDKESRKKDVYIGVEFVKDDIPYYYGLTVRQGIVTEEELMISSLGNGSDELLFRRTDSDINRHLRLEFATGVMEDPEAALFPGFLQNEVLGRNQPVLFHMNARRNSVFERFTKALTWLTGDFVYIGPHMKPNNLPLSLDSHAGFRTFTCEMMRAFDTGVKEVRVDTIPIKEFFGKEGAQEAERIIAAIRAEPDKPHVLPLEHEQINFVLEKDEVFAKRLYFLHDTDGGVARFSAEEESDGTRRLLDYLPAFFGVIRSQNVYLIDEIERSIHPSLIKELVRKFSHDEKTEGQLIFSTHESNLLDQDIFRPDEIWFAEKEKGATRLAPLSEYRVHHTIDIRKGYLNGRFNAIPFLGNLKDLNWD